MLRKRRAVRNPWIPFVSELERSPLLKLIPILTLQHGCEGVKCNPCDYSVVANFCPCKTTVFKSFFECF